MNDQLDILLQVRETAQKKVLFLPHALRQMSRPDRMISTAEIRSVIEHGEVIENYTEDTRGKSCLMLGYGESKRPLHVVCTPKEDYLAIITAYLPEEAEWSNAFRVRKKS